jgi:all-trans-retinol 13,14-reductase
MIYDVVVIGAGLGGLSAAATLAKKGLKVHVIESHDKVGGFASNYRRGKFRMEAGIHMLAGDHSQSLYSEVFDYFNFLDKIPLVKIPQFYQCFFDDKSFVMPFGIAQATEELILTFPLEKDGIEKYFSMMIFLTGQFRNFIFRQPFIPATNPFFPAIFPQFDKYWKISIGQYLNSIIQNKELKMILLANVTFYHDKHYEMNLVQYMVSQINYFIGGGYYIEGGSQVFSDYLKKIIEDNNGLVTLRHKVEKICVENQKAKRVLYRKVIGSDSELKSCESKFIIVNGAPPNTYEHMLESDDEEDIEYFKNMHAKSKSWGLSTSATTVYFGLKKPLQKMGSRAYMNLFIETKNHDQLMDPNRGSIGVIDYNQIPTKLCSDGIYCSEVILMDQKPHWEKLKYDENKDALKNNITEKMTKYFTNFKDQILFSEVSTPKTILRYTHAPEGAIYGYLPSMESFRQRSSGLQIHSGSQDEKIKNLFFASAWSFLPGFNGTLIAGYKTALELERHL